MPEIRDKKQTQATQIAPLTEETDSSSLLSATPQHGNPAGFLSHYFLDVYNTEIHI